MNALEDDVRPLEDSGLRERFKELRDRRARGEKLTDLMPETFAVVREACRRAIDIRQFDVQVAGGAGLARDAVIEMRTGEGKTFVAPLAACLFALDGQGVHVLTANDYLAGRDHDILKPVYDMLGLKTASVLSDTDVQKREKAYRADITYTTVQQLGFDFLRQCFWESPDTLRKRDMWRYLRSDIDGSTPETRSLRGRQYAILDEVDSILVDYARTPLSMSVEADTQRPEEVYTRMRDFVTTNLENPRDYTVDRARREVELTDSGEEKLEGMKERYGYLNLMDSEWEARLKEAIRAEHLYKKGDHYVVKDSQAVLIDQTSGRLMLGQRLGGELHQALEAKENLPIQPRRTTAKKVTIQSLMRPYETLAGMTGTAWEARREFSRVYDLATVRFSPRVPLKREYLPDLYYCDPDARWEDMVSHISDAHDRGQPVLIGTRSVEKSRKLSSMLEEEGVPHDVLNAVDHAREAEIISEAGKKGRVTVSTHMAGRGVEIKLGEGVPELGGLLVMGAERHILGRMDRQLAGRCGRRGQPGTIQFYGSLDDDVLQIIPEKHREKLKRKYGKKGGEGFHARKVQKLFDKAQSQYASHYAEIRRRLLVEDLAEEQADKALFGQQRL